MSTKTKTPKTSENKDSKGKFIFFDTETTGLMPGNICQLTYVIAEGKNVIGKNFFFEVDAVEPGAQKVHGFSVEKLKELSGGKRFKDHSAEVLKDFQSADFLIAHNIQFDMRFIKTELRRENKEFDPDNLFCTMEHFTNYCKLPRKFGSGYKWPKLEELSPILGIKPKEVNDLTAHIFKSKDVTSHDARRDVAETYLCWLTGLEKGLIFKKEFGIDNIEDYKVKVPTKAKEHHEANETTKVSRKLNTKKLTSKALTKSSLPASKYASALAKKFLGKEPKQHGEALEMAL